MAWASLKTSLGNSLAGGFSLNSHGSRYWGRRTSFLKKKELIQLSVEELKVGLLRTCCCLSFHHKCLKALVTNYGRAGYQLWHHLKWEIGTPDTGNIRAMFKHIKKAIAPTPTKCARLKSLNGEIIQDKAKQLKRWVEHQITNQQKLGTYPVFDKNW